MTRTRRNIFAAVWLLTSVVFGAVGADPAYTMGSIVCAVVFVAGGSSS